MGMVWSCSVLPYGDIRIMHLQECSLRTIGSSNDIGVVETAHSWEPSGWELTRYLPIF